jgi:hypothetical protein
LVKTIWRNRDIEISEDGNFPHIPKNFGCSFLEEVRTVGMTLCFSLIDLAPHVLPPSAPDLDMFPARTEAPALSACEVPTSGE